MVQARVGAPDASQMINAALEAFKARDRVRCGQWLRQAVESPARLGDQWRAVSSLARVSGEAHAAVEAARRWMQETSVDPRRAMFLAETLAHSGRIAEARDVAAALTAQHPGDSGAWHLLGTIQSQLGQTDKALEALRRAISIQPKSPLAAWSWHAVAEARRFEPGDPDIAAMSALLDTLVGEAVQEPRSALLFGLAKAFSDTGQDARSFRACSEGAAIMTRRRRFDGAASDAFVDALISGWTSDFHAALPSSGVASDRPVFVFGLPRSGTTLVEQILASHSAVAGGGEINLASVASMRIGSPSPTAVRVFADRGGPSPIEDIGADYLHLLDQRFGADGRIIDKSLNQSRYLGLLHKALPNARFVWMVRDPGAVAWSCFSTRFAQGADWSWSLSDMGRFFRSEDRLRAHWSSLLGDALLVVRYEDVVEQPDEWTRRIVAHVGLSYEPAMANFHRTERAVTTSSFAQVRQPIYRSSLEKWRRHEDDLAPFFEAYRAG